MSNFLNNTIDLEKILNEVEGIDELIAQIKEALNGENSGNEGNAPSTPTLITFTIDDTIYQAEEGMTWAEWVESDYNTTGLNIGISDLEVYNIDESSSLCENGGEFVLPGHVIESGKNFHWE